MKIKRLLSLALALMLVLSLAPTAFAADNYHENASVFITKTFNRQVALENDVTFTFSVEQYIPENGDPKYTSTSAPVTDTTPTVTYHTGDVNVVEAVSVGLPEYTEAGIYKYIIKENWDENNPPIAVTEGTSKWNYSKAEYELDVYVKETVTDDVSSFVVYAVTAVPIKDEAGNAVSNGGKKSDLGDTTNNGVNDVANALNFVNTYVYTAGKKSDPSDPKPEVPDVPGVENELPDNNYDNNGSLALRKFVVANNALQEENTDTFTFNVTVTYPVGTDADTISEVTATAGGATVTATGTDLTYTYTDISLANMKALIFEGMPVGTKVKIQEEDAKNYKGTGYYVVDGEQKTAVNTTGYKEALNIPEFTLGEKTNSVVVTNNNIATPPTGVALEILPFVLMIALAGGLLFLMAYTKRRRRG